MQTGAIIVASGKKAGIHSFQPMIRIGNNTAVLRLINTFRKKDVAPIIIVGNKDDKLEKHVSRMNVIYLSSADDSSFEMIDYVKTGLSYLEKKCKKILITPVNVPLFTEETISCLMNANALIAGPMFQGKSGHPILISTGFIPAFLNYRGDQGLKGAIDSCGVHRTLVEVTDPGILYDVNSGSSYHELLVHNTRIHPQIKIQLIKDDIFFNSETAQLLSQIDSTGSVRLACEQMTISYSQGWKIISVMEEQLGFSVVNRRQGGKNGGSSCLTVKGRTLIAMFYEFEADCRKAMKKSFSRIFKEEL